MANKAGKTAGEIGFEIRDGFAESTVKGWEILASHMNSDGIEGYHIPAMAVDGLMMIDRDALAFEAKGFAQLGFKMVVDQVRPLSDDTVIIEMTWSGRMASGPFSFPMPIIFTVMAGKIVRAIEVCDFDTPIGREFWETMATIGYHGGSAVNMQTGTLSAGA